MGKRPEEEEVNEVANLGRSTNAPPTLRKSCASGELSDAIVANLKLKSNAA
jgi:hypothetical protein